MTVNRERLTMHLLGTTPMLHNCLSEKARQELLLPSPKVYGKARELKLKHNPLQEFRDSIYFNDDKKAPTLVEHLSAAFRKAMQNAALDLPGTTKSEIGRMVWVEDDRIPIYGLPQLDMRIVRQAGMNRTPDVRTRCYMHEWAATITVNYMSPQLTAQSVANLCAAAGMYIGVGDYRNEKGAGNYGLWKIVSATDKDFKRITKLGRKVQVAAMEAPTYSNTETEKLHGWFEETVKERRTLKPAKAEKPAKAKKKSNGVRAQA